jgi:hypothetical protein
MGLLAMLPSREAGEGSSRGSWVVSPRRRQAPFCSVGQLFDPGARPGEQRPFLNTVNIQLS